jgi:hypothetical protein
MNAKQQELVESINKSLSSVFTKEDVLSIIKNFQDAQEAPKPSTVLDPDILRSVLENIDFENYIDKDISYDSSAISFDIDTDSRGGTSFSIEVNVDESTIEDAVEVDVSISDTNGLVDEIMEEYANKLANQRVI